MSKLSGAADRLETVYLGTLRIIVLVFATVALVGATLVAGEAVRRLMTDTDVPVEPVAISAADVIAEKAAQQSAKAATAPTAEGVSEQAANAYQRFLKGPFQPYYEIYRRIAGRYNKPEDRVLTADALARSLGYGPDDYYSGENRTVALFYTDADYAGQVVKAANEYAGRAGVTAELSRYKAAQKTAKACRTDFVTRRVWDSGSTACNGWWEDPVGCPMNQQVPVERCEPAYPEGITSPGAAFSEFDATFRGLWAKRAEAAEQGAAAERAKRETIKSGGVPAMIAAGVILGAFLVVMFLFLVIAMERHLRKLSAAQPALTTPQPPSPAAARKVFEEA